MVQNFNPTLDSLTLLNFGSNEAATALSSATTISGSEQLSLSEGTKIPFVGVTGLGSGAFV